jgi:hypothetical protein
VLFKKMQTLRMLYLSRTGQVLGHDSLAMWLRAIASDPDVSNIVEIGAWEGKGSTRVFAETASRRLDKKSMNIVSLESSRQRALRAQKRNKKFGVVQIIWGSIVTAQDLDHKGLSANEIVWINEDINALENCPLVLDSLPNFIDALFLDGGEFSTRAEYDKLFDRVTKWIILDDTCTRKSASIAGDIRAGKTPFAVVVDSQQRNGFMVAIALEKYAVRSLKTI